MKNFLLGSLIFLSAANISGQESFPEIIYTGDESSKKEVLALIDSSLRKNGDLGVYGDLSGGLQVLLEQGMAVSVSECKEGYDVSIWPAESSHGHDFSLTVSPKGEISGVVVGEILPPPELND